MKEMPEILFGFNYKMFYSTNSLPGINNFFLNTHTWLAKRPMSTQVRTKRNFGGFLKQLWSRHNSYLQLHCDQIPWFPLLKKTWKLPKETLAMGRGLTWLSFHLPFGGGGSSHFWVTRASWCCWPLYKVWSRWEKSPHLFVFLLQGWEGLTGRSSLCSPGV